MNSKLHYLLFFLFANSFYLFSASQRIDSVAYYQNLSNYNIKIRNYEKAINFASKSLRYSQSTQNITAQIVQHFAIGKLFFDLKEFNQALPYFEQSFMLNTKIPANSLKVNACYYIGFCSLENKEWLKAAVYFSKADQLATTEKWMQKKVNLLLLRKAKAYFKANQLQIAEINFNRVLAQCDPNSEKSNIEEVYLYTGIIALENKNFASAQTLLDAALSTNVHTKNLKNKEIILLNLNKCFKGMHNYDRAYSYLEEYHLLKIHLSQKINAEQNAENFKKFKLEEKYKALIEKNKERQKIADNNKYSKVINILALALISILSLLSLSLYKNNIIRTETNTILKEKNQELLIAKNNAEKASKARSEFLSTVSHELRTPLNAINGIAHLLLEEKPKKSQLKYLASLQFSGNYLATFINEILEINKIDANKIELESISFHLKDLLSNIQSSLNKFALTNNNEFILDFDEKIPLYLIGDPTKLSQVFLNLINNALKFTHNGKVTISAHLLEKNNDTTKINFQIIDTGIGIPEEKLELVFENFSQGSVEINRKYGGTGLGLTIVKKLVKVLGGKIKLVSEEGKGATFSFALPFKIAENKDETIEKTVNYCDEQFKSKKILLVEDNKINQMITKKMLENKGIICIVIDNGEGAVQLMNDPEHEYDLVLMDVHLPGINGTIATQQIRTFDSKTPIIALTAISLDENREMLLSYGMNDVITKPFIPEEFYTVISKYV
ncbi:MAG: ATP-binding protein [Flavobacterium sp.]